MEHGNTEMFYHFTSLESLNRIVTDGYLSLSDITKSNDPSEGTYVLDAMQKACRKLWEDREVTREQYVRLHNLFYDFCEQEKTGGRLRQAVLSLSFCEPRNFLPLWRIYGDGGRGVAIGIPNTSLEKLGKQNDFAFRKVQYYEESELLHLQKDFWRRHLNDDEEALLSAVHEQYMDGYFIKRKENEYENEWRLVYTGVNLEKYLIPGLEPEVPERVDAYRRGNDMVLCYHLPVNQEELIERIILGPQCNIKACEMNVFMKKHHVPYKGAMYASEIMG